MRSDLSETVETNNHNIKEIRKVNIAYDTEVVRNLKLKELVSKLLNQKKELENKIIKLEDIITDKDDAIRLTKLENKKLKKNNDGTHYLEKYQMIKNYLIQNNMSLGRFCIRNGYDKNIVFENFVNLKMKRINAAHPTTIKKIINDKELYDLLR